jgi:hypothetical protein
MGTVNICFVVCFIALLIVSRMIVEKLDKSKEEEDNFMSVKLTKRISNTVSSTLDVAGAIGVNLLAALLLS